MRIYSNILAAGTDRVLGFDRAPVRLYVRTVPRDPEHVAPAVRIRRTGQIVLLLEWVCNRQERWEAHVAWLVLHGGWRGVNVWLPGEDLEKISGEDYRRVPRRHADDFPF
jgi:hypothetical protein